MPEPDKADRTSAGDESPYAPPPMIADSPSLGPTQPVPPLPVAFIFIYSLIATAVTMGLATLETGPYSYFPLFALIGLPTIAIAGFIALYFSATGPQAPLASISITWKVLMLILVPPASMICFVPTCIGSTVFLLPIFRPPRNDWGLVLPILLAYTTTCFMVAHRLRSRIVRIAVPVEPSYPQIVASDNEQSPFAAPKAKVEE